MLDFRSSGLLAVRPGFDVAAILGHAAEPHAERDADYRPATVADILTVRAGVANIRIDGVIAPNVWRCEGTDTAALRAAVERAVRDPAVSAIRLVIDSPGGIVAGLSPIYAALRDSAKPVSAYVRTECCSAAYHLAATAKAGIFAEREALIGCLGVYQVIKDASAAVKAHGITVRVYASDPLKGLGVWGAPISEEQDAFLRDFIAKAAANFWRDIHACRPQLSKAAFTGAYHFPEAALDLGLIDDFQI